jgi:hypothetical protein
VEDFMNFQLVIQFQCHTGEEFDEFIVFEDELIAELSESAIVDGHDYGSGEFNIFVLTNNPEATFEHVQILASRLRLGKGMRAAYRAPSEVTYVVLWPPDATSFAIA